jgi:hypothetical protein
MMEMRYEKNSIFEKKIFFNFTFFKTPRNTGLLHRRVHLNDLPNYLITGASKELTLHRTRSPSVSSASHYEDSSGFFGIEQNDTPRSLTAVPRKRYYDDELTYSNKRHVLTERVIPVNHQRATLVRDEKPTVGKRRVCFD